MSAAFLREAAAAMRNDAVDEYDISSETFWTALADWLDQQADLDETLRKHGARGIRVEAEALPGPLAVAAAYLNRPPP